jgi:hypothetical protein
MAINRQPLFTANPILEFSQFDPEIPTDLHNTNRGTAVYTDNSTHGSLITKITVNSPAALGDRVTTKRIYLMITDKNTANYNILDSRLMTGISNSAEVTDIPPSVVFEFPTGLITSPDTILGIAATTNRTTSGFDGDRVVVIVEGGTYDEPA